MIISAFSQLFPFNHADTEVCRENVCEMCHFMCYPGCFTRMLLCLWFSLHLFISVSFSCVFRESGCDFQAALGPRSAPASNVISCGT